MFKFLFVLLLCFSLQGAQLGVLYSDATTNNQVSPPTVTIPNLAVGTNLNLVGKTPSRVLLVGSDTNITVANLTQTQANQLASWVGGATTLVLGSAKIISGEGSPTNGSAYVERILYINSTGTNLNDTYWGNYGTNWYAIASTNGGSITESQINFSDNTTGNFTTNMHGFVPKGTNSSLLFLTGTGLWLNPNSPFSSLTINQIPVSNGFGSFADSDIISAILPAGDYGVKNNRSWNVYRLVVTNLATINAFGGTTNGDVSITAHGLTPTLPNDATKFLNGVGGWSIPGGGSGTVSTSGSPAPTEIAYFTGSGTISGVPSSSVSVAGVGIPTLTTTTSLNINTNDTVGNIHSSTYTPTVTAVSVNCSTSGATQTECKYVRIGKMVQVSGKVQVIKLNSSALNFRVSLPIASNLEASYDASGTVSGQSATSPSQICGYGVVGARIIDGDEQAEFYLSGDNAAGTVRDFWFNFTYQLK